MTSITQSCKMNRIILALLEHGTKQKAAAALGISEVTVWRWMQKSEFQQAYHQVLREYNCRKIGKLLQASTAAVATLCRLMLDPTVPPSVRVRAAGCVLEHAKG